jgi:hypothetical protein
MVATWTDSSWTEKRYKVEIWRCDPYCTSNPGYFYYFAVANKENTIGDSFTKPAAWPDENYKACIVTQSDASNQSARVCAPTEIYLFD